MNNGIHRLIEDGKVQPEKVHEFHVPSPHGMQTARVAHSQMKRCPCGCDLFDLYYHIGFAKPPQLGAPVLTMRVEVFVCAECGVRLEGSHPMVGDKKEGE